MRISETEDRNKCISWVHNNSHKLMAIFIIIQCLISVAFLILYFVESVSDVTIRFKIYSGFALALFTTYMIHFAYHSITSAYVIELIAFLFMSTVANVLLIVFYVYYVLNYYDSNSVMYCFAIIFIVIASIGNCVYYYTAYYSYQHFDDIFMEKLGAKLIYHEMFKYSQFQHSIVKTDTGLIALFCATCFIFEDWSPFFDTCDVLLLAFVITNIFLMKYFLRYENKVGVISFLVARVLFEGYVIYRCTIITNSTDEDLVYLGKSFTISIVSVDGALVAMMIGFSLKCISNFGKGLREMINKQKSDELNNTKTTDSFDI